MTDTYAINVYRTEIAELVGSEIIAGRSAWLARLQLNEAERALTVTGDEREYLQRLEHVATNLQQFEDAR